ncbi:exocyst complex component 3 [Anaeramoeba ignava]|uniref:Exocyst complex component 3 n=1 Tax=Anaeramoeba ignava TaxID=1746090 RepID=A0A9Q0LA90_ANAIG|nr:exocyst complex component 3 [Anaeramoeba ignava]
MSKEKAKKEAKNRIGVEIAHPTDLRKIHELKEQTEKVKAEIDSKLQAMMQSQINSAQKGADLLQVSDKTVKSIHEHFKSIKNLSNQNQGLIPNYSEIRILSMVGRNMRNTLIQLRKLFLIRDEVRKIEAHLNNERLLFENYEKIRELMILRLDCLNEIQKEEKNENQNAIDFINDTEKDSNMLFFWFNEIQKLCDAFFNQIWKIAENILQLSRENPMLIKTSVMILEIEDSMENKILEIKSFREEFIHKIQERIYARFEQEFGDIESIGESLEKILDLLEELDDFKDYVEPLLPKKYNIVFECSVAYHLKVFEKFHIFSSRPDIEIEEILTLVSWIKTYNKFLLRFGIRQTKPKLIERLGDLTDRFHHHMQSKMKSWFLNILSVDRELNDIEDNPIYSTPTPLDLFKTISQQMQTALDELPFGYLCAVVNDSYNCVEYTNTWKQELLGLLDPEYAARVINSDDEEKFPIERIEAIRVSPNSVAGMSYLDPEIVADGFHEISMISTSKIAKIILMDLQSAFDLFFSDHWFSQADNQVMLLVIGTLEDYFEDLYNHIWEFSLKKICNFLLEEISVWYIFRMATGNKNLSPATRDLILSDLDLIREFFLKYVRQSSLDSYMQPLVNVTAFATCLKEQIKVNLESIMSSSVDFSIEIADSILSRRVDLEKKFVKDFVVETKGNLNKMSALNDEFLLIQKPNDSYSNFNSNLPNQVVDSNRSGNQKKKNDSNSNANKQITQVSIVLTELDLEKKKEELEKKRRELIRKFDPLQIFAKVHEKLINFLEEK